ncbi:lysozyme inhibitor LprI family protein [Thiofilum flexile]|uniref:lysozyme inhibitor LprI family protein n=1 Tax=Thiofilum flexile TaxID=125627 RepID=UPI00036110A1|nr:lysozyme inhibitor LprI family protein [Thiofilum flexile]
MKYKLFVLMGLFLFSVVTVHSMPSDYADELKKSDKALTKVYKELMAELKRQNLEVEVKKLKEAERAWIKYREAQCDFENRYLAAGAQCTLKEIQAREQKLKELLTYAKQSAPANVKR